MKKTLSILIPVFNESESIEILYFEIKKILFSLNKYRSKIIFINDGSTDDSENIIEKLSRKDKQMKIINFEKNLGKTMALSEGFKMADGDFIITMDADLQDNPSNIPLLLNKIYNGYDLVTGWRKKRSDPKLKILSSRIFNFLIKNISGVKLHDFNCGLKIMKKEVAKSLNMEGDMHRFIPLLVAKQGFMVGEVEVIHRKRLYGKSKYGLQKVISSFFTFLKIV